MVMPVHDPADWEAPPTKLCLPSLHIPRFYIFSKKSAPIEIAALPPVSHATEKFGVSASEQSTGPDGGIPRPVPFALRPNRILVCAAFVLILLVVGLGLGLGIRKKLPTTISKPLPSVTGIYTGDITYYDPGPGYGACGYENTFRDPVCAVSHFIFDVIGGDTNPNNNPICGRKIRITRYDASSGGNRSVDVKVVDRCVGCAATDLDLSLAMFTRLADEAIGRTQASWAWLD